MTRTPGREGLDDLHGPWPSLADELIGLYGGEWTIYRERFENGQHGDWVAQRQEKIELTQEFRRAGLANFLREPTSKGLHKALAFQNLAHKAVTVHSASQ